MADDTSLMRAESFAAHSGGQFIEPWVRRVREVDDHTLAGLLKTLIGLRRVKMIVAAGAAICGGMVFGFLKTKNPIDAILIYGTLSAFCTLPVFAGGTLAVRHLFLKEAQRHGIKKSTSTLILTRAERRARTLAPWKNDDERVELLLQAVREPDTA